MNNFLKFFILVLFNGLSGNLSSSMSVCGDVSDTLVSISLLLASVVMIGDQINCRPVSCR